MTIVEFFSIKCWKGQWSYFLEFRIFSPKLRHRFLNSKMGFLVSLIGYPVSRMGYPVSPMGFPISRKGDNFLSCKIEISCKDTCSLKRQAQRLKIRPSVCIQETKTCFLFLTIPGWNSTLWRHTEQLLMFFFSIFHEKN